MKSNQQGIENEGRRKKPFYLRWWFILIVIIIGIPTILNIGSNGEKIKWDDIILGEMLPEPPSKRGKIYENSMDELWISVNELADKQFVDYIRECEDTGFVIEAKSDSFSYVAYNDEGYKLSLTHYGNESDMDIHLEKPIEMTVIEWPTGIAGLQLPVPESLTGKFLHERDEQFYVYIGNTSKEDYNNYVSACVEVGFDVDYDKSEDRYSAKNGEGWRLSIGYEGNNVMSIEINAPIESESTTSIGLAESHTEETVSSETSNIETVAEPTPEPTPMPTILVETPTENTKSQGLNPEFKAAMDSYEQFMDEYIAFMKKYKDNPSDLSLLMDYAGYMSDYAEFVASFENWQNAEMNADEASYYIEVQARVTQRLLEVAQ